MLLSCDTQSDVILRYMSGQGGSSCKQTCREQQMIQMQETVIHSSVL